MYCVWCLAYRRIIIKFVYLLEFENILNVRYSHHSLLP